MSFKDRLFGIQLEEQERQHQEKAERERRRIIAERTVVPKILSVEEVAEQEVERIVQIADSNIVRALGDFGEVMWGSDMTDVDRVKDVRERKSYTWFVGDKSSRVGTKTTYSDFGTQRYVGYSRICRVKLGIISVPENKFIEISTEEGIFRGPESQRKRKRDVERDYGVVKWKHASGVIRTRAYWLHHQPQGRFDYCAVMIIGGVNHVDRSVVFGFDEHSYLEKLEVGLERMVRIPENLSEYRDRPPFSYEH